MAIARPPIRFDLIGSNERTRNALAMAFIGRAKGSCEFADGSNNADAVIVDLDGTGARAEWSKYRHQHPDRPSVLLSLGECTVPEQAIVLIKPIRIEALLSAVDDVRRRIETGDINAPGVIVRTVNSGESPVRTVNLDATVRSVVSRSTARRSNSQSRQAVATAYVNSSNPPAPPPGPNPEIPLNAKPEVADTVRDFSDVVGAAADIDCGNLEQLRHRCFDAEGTIIDWVRRAHLRSEALRRPVVVAIQDRDIVTISSVERVAKVMISEAILKANCTRRFVDSQVTLREVNAEQAPAEAQLIGTPVSLETLQWNLGLWTYQGRLPAGTPIQERVYLRRWPNFSRLIEFPDAMRISALLVEQPLTLPRVAEALAIPQRHVFAFYAAACAAGLANQAKRESDRLVATAVPRKHVEHGFINRVVDRLRRLVA